MFAKAMLNALRILTQILKSWLMITLKWNTRLYCLFLTPCSQVKGKGGHKEYKERNTNQVFHFKVITSQDLRICVNIHIALSIALAKMGCEGFSITHIFVFYPDIISYFVYYLIYFKVSYRLYLMNSVTWLCISFNLIIPFF
jgi:hypothetical protein